MGVWGGLCAFDYDRYRREVLTAFREGEQHSFIQVALALKRLEHSGRYPIQAFCGLAQFISFCDSEMTTCSLGRNFVVYDGIVDLELPPKRKDVDCWNYEDIADLFERVLTRHAITHYTVLGLRYYAVRHLFPSDLYFDDVTQSLLHLLDYRCQYWAVGGCGYGEGIQGWLDPEETELLVLGLNFLRPGQVSSNSVADSWLRLLSAYCQENGTVYSDHLERIAQFTTLLEQAHRDGHGILWGRDLRLFYDNHQLFAPNESKPIKL